MSFHPAAWAAWLLAAVAVAVVPDDPWIAGAAIAMIALTASALALPTIEGRTWILFVRLGIAFIVLRVVLFGLTGHTGATTIATTPAVSLPGWLGGFTVGGRITAEVVAQSVLEGLKIAALLLAGGTVLSIVATHRLMRALPRFLYEAGLVVGIALAFVPTLVRAARDVRDAQRLRGHRARGLRGARALIVPVLHSSLDRSLTLAASMETRGFGRAGAAGSPGARALAIGGATAATAGAALALFGRPAGGVLLALGALATAAGIRALGAGQRRTRLRPESVTAWDAAMIVCAVLTTAGVIGARAAGVATWSPYPAFAAPPVGPGVLAAFALAAPAALHAARLALLRRASARAVVPGHRAEALVR